MIYFYPINSESMDFPFVVITSEISLDDVAVQSLFSLVSYSELQIPTSLLNKLDLFSAHLTGYEPRFATLNRLLDPCLVALYSDFNFYFLSPPQHSNFRLLGSILAH